MIKAEPQTGAHKADFSTIYGQPDPRSYFRTLRPLDYQIPQQARPLIECVHSAVGRERPMLDVCCSYGINGGLLRYALDLDEMAARYTSPALADLSTDEVLEADLDFYRPRRRRPDVTVLGLDASTPAVDYGVRAGLINDGWSENLEDSTGSPELAAGLADVGLVVCTGGVGYIGEKTFDNLLRLVPKPDQMWLAVFVLREFGYDDIAAALDSYGLVTEQVPGATFRQRRFASAAEQQAAVHDVRSNGLDPAGKESDGWFHAVCYVTRPARAAADVPLTELLGGLRLG
jgi:hypothetical protein